jgi:hypothetical protein
MTTQATGHLIIALVVFTQVAAGVSAHDFQVPGTLDCFLVVSNQSIKFAILGNFFFKSILPSASRSHLPIADSHLPKGYLKGLPQRTPPSGRVSCHLARAGARR